MSKSYRKAFEKAFKHETIHETIPAEEFFMEYYNWKAAKEVHRERKYQLRKAAHKDFYYKNKVWFKTLDTIGIILIVMNVIALIITGLVVVKADPAKGFVEANTIQCKWNGWSCHEAGFATLIIPVLKQILIWTILVCLYLYTRSQTFTTTGMMILTAIIIFYCIAIGTDTFHDIGLYLGKIIWGV